MNRNEYQIDRARKLDRIGCLEAHAKEAKRSVYG